jgi:hypothetical protein
MPWIKKNLMLVLGGLVGLILLGGSGFFLFSEYSREASVNTELEAKRAEWDRLNNLAPFPDEKNIAAAKEEAVRLEKLSTELKGHIQPVAIPAVHDTLSLRVLVETTISELKKEAEASGVNLPDKFAFTFQKLREMPQIDSNSIPRLAEQVSQVSTICRILFRSKVHSLDTLRRPAILKEEGGSEFLTKKGATNALLVRLPFDFSFRCFSGELAEVIRNFAALDQCVVIKTVNVDPTTLPTKASPVTMPAGVPMPQSTQTGPVGPGGMDAALRARYGLGPMAGAGSRDEGGGPTPGGGMDAALRARYGLGPGGPGGAGGPDAMMRSRYGMGGASAMAPTAPTLSAAAPAQGAVPVAAAPAGPSVVLDEKPLRVIFQVDFVKPKPADSAGAKKAAPRAPAAEGGAAAAAPAADGGEPSAQ